MMNGFILSSLILALRGIPKTIILGDHDMSNYSQWNEHLQMHFWNLFIKPHLIPSIFMPDYY
jgi:hypothetical protein